jgi:hypothetical protein
LRRARSQRALEVVPRQIVDHEKALSYQLSAISLAACAKFHHWLMADS